MINHIAQLIQRGAPKGYAQARALLHTFQFSVLYLRTVAAATSPLSGCSHLRAPGNAPPISGRLLTVVGPASLKASPCAACTCTPIALTLCALQALGEVTVTRLFLENFSGDQASPQCNDVE